MGINFDQIFIAGVKPMDFQALFAIVLFYNLDIEQIDIKTAFLLDIIDQFLYMEVLRDYK